MLENLANDTTAKPVGSIILFVPFFNMLLTVLYAVAIFLGSFLLFLVEPMVGKRLAPLLGGSAAVWAACLVFFQTTLLLGYLAAHWLATRVRPRVQGLVYLALLAAGLPLLALNLTPHLYADTSRPILSSVEVLLRLIGLPFLLLSAAGPLLQAWYSQSSSIRNQAMGSESGTPATNLAPPYRLFALSNFASLLALTIYPAWVEPLFSLHAQVMAWSIGFLLFTVTCGLVVWRENGSLGALGTTKQESASAHAEPEPAAANKLLWFLLAACGSLLLCAVTNHLSQNVAAIPLLWTIPLIMYLLSFVIAFNGERFYRRPIMLGLLAVMVGATGYVIYDTRGGWPIKVAVPFFCFSLLIACLFCHAELHRLRPSPRHATSFYVLIAAGGAAGAFFVGVLAPVVFSANYELASGLLLVAALALAVTWRQGLQPRLLWAAATVGMGAVIFLQAQNYHRNALIQLRSFYGALRVVEKRAKPQLGLERALYHGTIQHGIQFYENGLRTTPTTYYAPDSGVGLALNLCCNGRPRRVGIIGLGAGTVAAYGQKGDVFRFYEIDPLVERLAQNLFSYTRESAATVNIVLGDARVSLANEAPQNFDVLAIDAFSGDAIPVHLLTAEALALYRRHLQPGGIIAFHVSSQYLDLVPVIQQEADHAGLQAVYIDSDEDESRGEYSADWVLVSANKDFMARPELAKDAVDIEVKKGLRLWTDDYNSLLPILK
ncbi:MAG TPA: fused MFS/spermidine synthase [Candidatus Angelobacter sp.]|nr:fused MFS/spermidine synthase [Candidatus Angelobacter sp.]